MHYSNLVIVPKTEHPEETLGKLMGPPGDEGGFWDWYVIGGLWTGVLDDYDPISDPRNQEICSSCDGTGKRNGKIEQDSCEQDPSLICSRCDGKGKTVEWYGKLHEGDIAPIESVTEEQYRHFYRVILPEFYDELVSGRSIQRHYGQVYKPEYWVPWETKFLKQEMPPLAWIKKTFPNHLAVVVDTHEAIVISPLTAELTSASEE
jgi:hypothetical protein